MKQSLLLVLFLFVFLTPPVHAQDLTPTPTPVPYTLPYPGILPGHPLYFLKDARDSFLSFFLSHSLKKAEFELLQADKQMQAAVFLVKEKRKSDIIFATLSRSLHSFRNALSKGEEAKKQGMDTTDLSAKMVLAHAKYQEILRDFIKQSKGEDKKKFTTELEKIKEMEKAVLQLRAKQ